MFLITISIKYKINKSSQTKFYYEKKGINYSFISLLFKKIVYENSSTFVDNITFIIFSFPMQNLNLKKDKSSHKNF